MPATGQTLCAIWVAVQKKVAHFLWVDCRVVVINVLWFLNIWIKHVFLKTIELLIIWRIMKFIKLHCIKVYNFSIRSNSPFIIIFLWNQKISAGREHSATAILVLETEGTLVLQRKLSIPRKTHFRKREKKHPDCETEKESVTLQSKENLKKNCWKVAESLLDFCPASPALKPKSADSFAKSFKDRHIRFAFVWDLFPGKKPLRGRIWDHSLCVCLAGHGLALFHPHLEILGRGNPLGTLFSISVFSQESQ